MNDLYCGIIPLATSKMYSKSFTFTVICVRLKDKSRGAFTFPIIFFTKSGTCAIVIITLINICDYEHQDISILIKQKLAQNKIKINGDTYIHGL